MIVVFSETSDVELLTFNNCEKIKLQLKKEEESRCQHPENFLHRHSQTDHPEMSVSVAQPDRWKSPLHSSFFALALGCLGCLLDKVFSDRSFWMGYMKVLYNILITWNCTGVTAPLLHSWCDTQNGFGLVRPQVKNICLNYQKFNWIENLFPTFKFQQVLEECGAGTESRC